MIINFADLTKEINKVHKPIWPNFQIALIIGGFRIRKNKCFTEFYKLSTQY